MIKEGNVSGGFWWRCLDCGHISRSKTDVAKHVEAKHIESEGFSCYYCGKFCPSKNALQSHISRMHRHQDKK